MWYKEILSIKKKLTLEIYLYKEHKQASNSWANTIIKAEALLKVNHQLSLLSKVIKRKRLLILNKLITSNIQNSNKFHVQKIYRANKHRKLLNNLLRNLLVLSKKYWLISNSLIWISLLRLVELRKPLNMLNILVECFAVCYVFSKTDLIMIIHSLLGTRYLKQSILMWTSFHKMYYL